MLSKYLLIWTFINLNSPISACLPVCASHGTNSFWLCNKISVVPNKVPNIVPNKVSFQRVRNVDTRWWYKSCKKIFFILSKKNSFWSVWDIKYKPTTLMDKGNDHLIEFHLTFSVDRNFLLIWVFDWNFYFFNLVSWSNFTWHFQLIESSNNGILSF